MTIMMRNKSHENEGMPDSSGSINRTIEEIDSQPVVVDQEKRQPTQLELLNKLINNGSAETNAQGLTEPNSLLQHMFAMRLIQLSRCLDTWSTLMLFLFLSFDFVFFQKRDKQYKSFFGTLGRLSLFRPQ